MKLSRKKAIELCIELWEWLAETGKMKDDWPEWGKYDAVLNDCWFCQYTDKYKGGCNVCPLTKLKMQCLDEKICFYWNWDKAKTPRTRKKYAKLFLKQIKSIK